MTPTAPRLTPPQSLAFACARFLTFPFTRLPYRLSLTLAWPLIRAVWLAAPRLRHRTNQRLRQVFGPSLPQKKCRQIAWIAFRNLLFTAIDALRIPSITPQWLASHLSTPDTEAITAALAQGHGAIVAVPHSGSWELAALALARKGFPLIAFFRKQRNPILNHWLHLTRSQFDLELIDVHSRAAVHAGRTIATKNCVLVITPDLRAKTGGYPVRFLGHQTSFPCGVAHYALAARCPVITAEVYRIGWTQHAWRQTGSIAPNPALSHADNARQIMQYLASRFDESIRRHPENYFWFNGRWVLPPTTPPP